MARLPLGALIAVLVAWALGSVTGGWVAAKLAAEARVAHAMVVGVVLVVCGVATMLMIPHPVWFWVAGIVVPLACALLGARVAGAGAAVSRT